MFSDPVSSRKSLRVQPLDAEQSSRRHFVGSAAAFLASLGASPALLSQDKPATPANPSSGGTTFDWQLPNKNKEAEWRKYSFDVDRWWGDFSKQLPDQMDMFVDNPWALGPFTKSPHNPVLAPSPDSWDQGRFSGGVHNGSIIIKDDVFHYIYRGERPIDIPKVTDIDYMCDIGLATSRDGVTFVKDRAHSSLFRKGADRRFSYEDVNLVQHEGTYYLFCNQWLWGQQDNHKLCGTFLATSKDLLNWDKVGIVFPNASRTHRNAVVLQNPHNQAVRINGKFVMYINEGLIAYSDDMVHWESHTDPYHWPGGECCFALADYDTADPNAVILFTGGANCGHFYAVGEVRLSRSDVTKPLAWLPRSPLFAELKYPFENGFSADNSKQMISSFADCIFFNGLTLHNGLWWLYYGGSEYYTCLASAVAR